LFISGWGTDINYNGGFTIEAFIDVDPNSLKMPIGPAEVDPDPTPGYNRNPSLIVNEYNSVKEN